MRTPIQIGSVAQQVESTGFTGYQYTSFAKNHLRPVLLERRFTDKNQSEELSPSFSSGPIETIGDQPLAARFSPNFGQIPIFSTTQPSIQAKLAIDAPNDALQQEADRVADQVTRKPEPELQRTCTCGVRALAVRVRSKAPNMIAFGQSVPVQTTRRKLSHRRWLTKC